MLWDVKNKKLLKTIKAAGGIVAQAWSMDGRAVAVALGKDGIELRDSDGNLIRSIRDAGIDVQAVFWSPDGRALGASGRSSTWMWDVKNGEYNLTIPDFIGSAFSPDGKLIAGYAMRYGNPVAVCDSKTGRILRSFPSEGQFYSWHEGLSWAGDETLVAANFAGDLRYWNVQTGEPRGVLLIGLPGTSVAAIGPEGSTRLTGGAEKSIVYITQTDAGQETLTPEEFRAKYNWHD